MECLKTILAETRITHKYVSSELAVGEKERCYQGISLPARDMSTYQW